MRGRLFVLLMEMWFTVVVGRVVWFTVKRGRGFCAGAMVVELLFFCVKKRGLLCWCNS